MAIHLRLLNRLGFKTRIFISFLSLAIPLLLSVSFILYGYLYDGVKQRTLQEIQKTVHESMVHLELLIEDTENLSRSILYNDAVQDGLHQAEKGMLDIPLASVSTFINSALAYRDFIDSVVIAAPSAPFFSTESATSDIIDMARLRSRPWFGAESRTDEPFLWVPKARQDEGGAPARDNGAMLLRKITSKRDYRTFLGTLMIYLRGSYVDDFLGRIEIGQSVDLWVLNERFAPVFQKNQVTKYADVLRRALDETEIRSTDQGSIAAAIDGRRYAISWSLFRRKEWRIVGIVPFSEVSSSLLLIKQQISVMVFFFALVSLIVSFAIASSISRPIKYLAKTMDTYGENPDPAHRSSMFRIYHQRQDEIGTIYDAYLRLVGRIDGLIRENYLKEIEKKEAELASLESQINPHFLYNTLDSINWIAMENGQSKISDMVTALADTFRLSLRKTDSPFISVGDELLHVKSYLVIQQHRYGSRLSCGFSVSENAERLFMLRFLLQPLIENALVHGADKVNGPVRIEISVAADRESLRVSIANDGAGADMEKIARLLSGESPQGAGYGIRNIHQRIKLVHGEPYGLSYRIDGARTVCILTLPVLQVGQRTESDA